MKAEVGNGSLSSGELADLAGVNRDTLRHTRPGIRWMLVSEIMRYLRFLTTMVDQVATAPCTGPIQVWFPLLRHD